MATWKIVCDDVLEWCKTSDYMAHAIICDPPYHLTGGFMQAFWDRDGPDAISFQKETWQALVEHLLPGGFIMAFGGSRTFHRLACAMEDAGLVLNSTVFLWAQGCLSEDTEILTQDGWKSHYENLTGSMVMCYNIETDTLEYMPIQEVFIYDYQDTAYRIKSGSTDQIVTRNHRCLVKRNGKLVFLQAEALECQEAVPILEGVSLLQETICGNELHRIPQKKSLLPRVCNRDLSQETQGCAAWSAQRQEQLYQGRAQGTYKERNTLSYLWGKVRDTFKDLAASRGASLFKKVCGCYSVTQYARTRTQQGNSRKSQVGSAGMDRRKSAQLLTKNERSQQPRVERGSYLHQAQGQLCQPKHQICTMPTGIHQHGPQGWLCDGASPNSCTGGRVSPEKVRGCSSYQSQCRGQQAGKPDDVQQQFSTQEIRSDWKSATTLATVTSVPYSGKVWCVRVPTGAFVARRNGGVFITGNSGFPKAANIHIQLEKRLCYKKGSSWYYKDDNEPMRTELPFRHPDADKFYGHRYGTQCLKPSVEPIIVAQKPWEGKRLDCIVGTGAGTLNIEAARISGPAWKWGTQTDIKGGGYGSKRPSDGDVLAKNVESHPKGRWPSNFALVHKKPETCPACDGEGTILHDDWYEECGLCDGKGVVGGCERVGVKRVKGHRGYPNGPGGLWSKDYQQSSPVAANWNQASTEADNEPWSGHADPDGMETMDAWSCQLSPRDVDWCKCEK